VAAVERRGRDERTAIVMIHTTSFRRSRAPGGQLGPNHADPVVDQYNRLAGEAGDTLMEVLISAMVIVLVVVATLTALNNANHATSFDRARSQADALAQQDEDELRSEPVAKLSELSFTHEVLLREVTSGGTHYTLTSTARYISDATATSSCTSTTPSANYIATSTEVTWPGIGQSKPVVETGIISPPADSALIVQVSGASGEPVAHMDVQSVGPTDISTETSSDGCAILAVSPGEYTLNVYRTGYVDQNGYTESDKDPVSNHSFYVVAEATAKKSFEFAPAGGLNVHFTSGTSGTATEGDSFVVFNTGLTAFRTFGTPGSYAKEVTSGKTLFPFTSNYVVYAGTCESDLPTANDSELTKNPEIEVPPNTTVELGVPLPPVNVQVMSGRSGEPGSAVSGASVIITDKGCGTERTFTTTAGLIPHPNLPFGKYSICVGSGGTSGRRWEGEFANNTVNGPSSTTWSNGGTTSNVATIYLGTSSTAPTPPGTQAGGTCP
jgi:Tfp pilus assembly protein PilV